VFWWCSEVSKSLAANLECFVRHFGQYGLKWMLNTNFVCDLTIEIPRLLYCIRMANAVSSTVKLVNSVTAHSGNSFNVVLWAFGSKCSPIELVPCSDGWRTTWWQTIDMIPGLPVSTILQCKYNCHEDACQELFEAIGRFKHTFTEAH